MQITATVNLDQRDLARVQELEPVPAGKVVPMQAPRRVRAQIAINALATTAVARGPAKNAQSLSRLNAPVKKEIQPQNP